jgi:hypothetical protein
MDITLAQKNSLYSSCGGGMQISVTQQVMELLTGNSSSLTRPNSIFVLPLVFTLPIVVDGLCSGGDSASSSGYTL